MNWRLRRIRNTYVLQCALDHPEFSYIDISTIFGVRSKRTKDWVSGLGQRNRAPGWHQQAMGEPKARNEEKSPYFYNVISPAWDGGMKGKVLTNCPRIEY